MTAGYIRFSAIFSWQRCRYPMTGSHLTTVSPSSSSMSLRSPCIAGCCGPMFMSMVSSPNSSLTSGEASRPLALPLGAYLEAFEERVVIKMILPHVEPAQVGVALEGDPEHVVGLPLVPVGRRVDVGDRRHDGFLALDEGLDPHPSTAQVQELVGQLERALPVHHRDEREVHYPHSLPRRRQHRRDRLGVDDDPHYVALHGRLLQPMAVAQALEVALEPALKIPLRQRDGHFRPSPWDPPAPRSSRSAAQLWLLPRRRRPCRWFRRSPGRLSRPAPCP